MELKKIYEIFLNSSGVSIDTRTIKQNNIYFAIKGPNFDGNKFANEAINKGAIFSVVDDEKFIEFDMKPVCKKCFEHFPYELKKRLKKANDQARIF